MNFYAFSAAANGICSLAAAWLIFNYCHVKGLKWTYILFCASVFWWSVFYVLWQLTHHQAHALLFCRMLMLGAIYIPIFYLHHLMILLNEEKRHARLLKFLYALSIVWGITTAFTPLIVKSVIPISVFQFWPMGGALFTPFLLAFTFTVLWGVYLIIKHLQGTTGNRRTQLRYVLAGTIMGWTGAATNFPLWYRIEFPPVGNLLVSGYLFCVGYAIVKHRLMDMTVIVRKTLIYSTVTSVLTVVYILVALGVARALEGWVVSPTAFSSVVAACAMALLFHPLRMKIQRFVDRHFFRESLDQELLREATSGFVHEIKRPLANISLPAELSLMDLQDLKGGRRSAEEILPKIEQRLQYILDQTADAGDKIEAIREVSNSDRRQAQNLDLLGIIRRGVEAEKSLCRRHQVEVKLELKENSLKIRGHAKQLEIVVTNLIKNAVEAMAGDEVQRERVIVIRAGRSEDQARMSVQDTGPGINPENLPHLFEPYFTTKGVHGMGMGLFLCRQIVQAHGGTLDVRCEPGQGAEFIVRFPIL